MRGVLHHPQDFSWMLVVDQGLKKRVLIVKNFIKFQGPVVRCYLPVFIEMMAWIV